MRMDAGDRIMRARSGSRSRTRARLWFKLGSLEAPNSSNFASSAKPTHSSTSIRNWLAKCAQPAPLCTFSQNNSLLDIQPLHQAPSATMASVPGVHPVELVPLRVLRQTDSLLDVHPKLARQICSARSILCLQPKRLTPRHPSAASRTFSHNDSLLGVH